MGRWATVGPTRGTRTANSSSLNRPLPSCQRLFDSRDLHPQGRYAPSLTGYLTRIAFGIDNRRCSRQKLAQLGVAEVAGTDSGPACGNFTVAGVRPGVVPGLFLPRLVENHGLRRDHSSYQCFLTGCTRTSAFARTFRGNGGSQSVAWSLLVNHQRAVCWGADNLTVEVTPHTAESIFGRTRLESALFLRSR